MLTTEKCIAFRKKRGDFSLYLRGQGIDVSPETEVLRIDEGTVEPWTGAANDMHSLVGLPDSSRDFVYASHRLQLVANVGETLAGWARVLRPGGHIYIIVPDYALFEKMAWPSRFRPLHQHSFSLIYRRSQVRRNNHYHVPEDVAPMLQAQGIELIAAILEDEGFDYSLGQEVDQSLRNAAAQICLIGRKSLGHGPSTNGNGAVLKTSPASKTTTVEEDHSLGIRLAKEKKWAEAEAQFRRIIQQNPNSAEAHGNLGFVLAQQKRRAEAEASFRLALQLKPTAPTGYANLGMACLEGGKLHEAEVNFWQAKQLGADVSGHLADVMVAQKKWAEAEVHLRDLLSRRPNDWQVHFKIANAYRRQKKNKEAEVSYREIIRLKTDHFDALNNLGILLEEIGKAADAEPFYRQALKLQPNSAEVNSNLGVALAALQRYDEASHYYREGIRLNPSSPMAHSNLGNTLRVQGKLDEAAASLQEAIRLRPDYSEAHNNLGIVLVQQGHVTEGISSYTEALRLRPDYPEAHLNRALAMLSEGDFIRGWPEYEWRWKGRNLKLRSYPVPRWDGSSIAGRTILLYWEQGLGDAMQFARFADVLAKKGAKVLLDCHTPLRELLKTTPGVSDIVIDDNKGSLPPFDTHAPLLSLPHLLGIGEESIPADVPYFTPDAARVLHWERELAGLDGFRIGIAWQGNPKHRGDRLRSVRFNLFERFSKVPGVTLCSLQKGTGKEQLAEIAGRFPVEDLGGRLSDSFADTAALMKHLDLIITVDTAICHLAGSLGIPVWVVLPTAADWRWLRKRSDSPWYPTMRLYRQSVAGEWESVFNNVLAELTSLVAGRSATERTQSLPTTAAEFHQRAIALARRNKLEQSLVDFEQAIQLDPDSELIHNNYGAILGRVGRPAEAAQQFQAVLDRNPSSIEALCNLASAHLDQGRFEDAVRTLEGLLRLKPNVAEYHLKLGRVWRLLGKDREAQAEACLREAIRLKPDYVEAHNSLGMLLEESRRTTEAEQCYREALRIAPKSPEAHNNLGVALSALSRWDEAVACFQESLRLAPNAPNTHNNLGNTLRHQGKLDEAIVSFKEALRLRPKSPEVFNNMGIALVQKGDVAEGITTYRKALELKPNYAEAFNNLAVAQADQHEYPEAIKGYEEAIRLKPDYADAHVNLALAFLGTGDYPRGWAEYEWRWKGKYFKLRSYPVPPWDGSSLIGRTILLYWEQGLGDTLQFVRFADLLSQQGAKVLLDCPEPLAELLARSPGVAQVVGQQNPLPEFDVHCPLMNLPGLIGTTVSTIPVKIPYLVPNEERLAYWQRETAALPGLRVGIVWQGNPKYRGDRNRSVHLAQFEALARLCGVTLCSMQKGVGSEQIAEVSENFAVHDLAGKAADNFADTAALAANLDLIITVDTAVAHLAGGLGIPVWVLVPFAADWRWLKNRNDSPWYPTMRLFRQATPRDWPGVIRDIKTALEQRLLLCGKSRTRF